MVNNNTAETMTITTALVQIIKQLKKRNLNSSKFWAECEPPLAYLHVRLGLTNMEIVFIAILAELGGRNTLMAMTGITGLTRFELSTYEDVLVGLAERGWIDIQLCDYSDEWCYALALEALLAFKENKAYKPDPTRYERSELYEEREKELLCNDEPGIVDCDQNHEDNQNNQNHQDHQDHQAPQDNKKDYADVKAFCKLTKHTAIQEKQLYYNTDEQKQVQHLATLLGPDMFVTVQHRMEEQNLRKGFACLLYGGPGTGKTETVLQIARQTGRDILQVNIAGLRSAYYGETESNVKQVFDYYRELCNNEEVTPILFFNEADGLFNKRTTYVRGECDIAENTLQNIFLQELEDLEGILIATTNLACNLDKAFDRRFIYKIKFTKPTTEVKAKIWGAMLKDVSKDNAMYLAANYDLAGGQIENVVRKRAVDYILFGRSATMDELEDYCRAEVLNMQDTGKLKERRRIGFIA